MTPERTHLPNRRPSHIETLDVAGQEFTACIGFDPATGRPCEIFLDATKRDSMFGAMLADAATVISIALQYSVPIDSLRKSVGRAADLSTMPGSIDQLKAGSEPASPIGAALDLLYSFESGATE